MSSSGSEPASRSGESDFPASEWLLAEYQILSEHYFHEDKLFMNVTNIFSTISGLLLVIVVGSDSTAPRPLQLAVPVFGVLLCVVWWAALYRIRRWRRNVEERIKELEELVRPLLTPRVDGALRVRPDGSAKSPQLLPATRGTRWLDTVPTTRLLLGLPLGIGAIWVFVGAVILVA